MFESGSWHEVRELAIGTSSLILTVKTRPQSKMNIHISYGTTARGDVLFLRQIRAGLGARNFGLMPCAALFTSSSRVPFVKFSCHTRPAYTRQLQIYAIGQLQKTSFSTSSRWRSIEGENAGEEKVQATPTTGSKPGELSMPLISNRSIKRCQNERESTTNSEALCVQFILRG